MSAYKSRIEILNKALNKHQTASFPSSGLTVKFLKPDGPKPGMSASAQITQRNQSIDQANSSARESKRIHRPMQPKLPTNKPNYIAGRMKPLMPKP